MLLHAELVRLSVLHQSLERCTETPLSTQWLDEIILHLFQPHQADQMFDPHGSFANKH